MPNCQYQCSLSLFILDSNLLSALPSSSDPQAESTSVLLPALRQTAHGNTCTHRWRPKQEHTTSKLAAEMDKNVIIVLFFLLLEVLVQCDGVVRVNLTAVVGRSVTFPDSVKEKAFILFVQKTIASVSNGELKIEEDIYTNRLHWNNSTGLFTLSDLQKSDSGVFKIDSKKENGFFKHYDLKVFEEVSVPVVSCVNVSSDSVTLQCSVNHTEQTTLSWFRGGQSVVSSSSAVLPLTVQQRNYTHQYKCVSQNPAEEKTATVKITEICTGENTEENRNKNKHSVKKNFIVLGVLVFIGIIVCIVFLIKKFSKAESPSLRCQERVFYAGLPNTGPGLMTAAANMSLFQAWTCVKQHLCPCAAYLKKMGQRWSLRTKAVCLGPLCD